MRNILVPGQPGELIDSLLHRAGVACSLESRQKALGREGFSSPGLSVERNWFRVESFAESQLLGMQLTGD